MKSKHKAIFSNSLAKIAVLSLIFLSVASTFQECHRMNIFADKPVFSVNQPVLFSDKSADPITLFGNRIEAIKGSLPAKGTIGYVSIEGTKSGEIEQYFQTQYFLSPLIVVNNSLNQDLIVGNFDDSESAHKFVADNGLILKKDFGNGLVLLNKEKK